MEKSSLVSVVITSFRGSKNLKRALDSAYYQTYPLIEIIVVDDNDPDTEGRKETERVMKKYISDHSSKSIMYVRHPRNMNGAVARNTGVSNAKGEYIQLLDDDDVLFPEKIEKSVALIKKEHTDGVLCSVASCTGTDINVINGARESIGLDDKRAEMMIVPGFLGTGSNVFVSKESYVELGGFDTSFSRMQDLEFMMRFFRKHRCSLLDEILIIKADNDRKVSWTDYRRQCDFKFKFWNKYEEDLKEAFTEEQRQAYFNLEYTHLFRIALMNESKSDIQEAAERLKTIRSLSRAEKFSMKYHAVYMLLHNNDWIVKCVRAMKAKKPLHHQEVQVTDAERAFIEKVMR